MRKRCWEIEKKVNWLCTLSHTHREIEIDRIDRYTERERECVCTCEREEKDKVSKKERKKEREL